MASIIRIDTPLGGPLNINGYLPALGASGYTGRYRASALPASVGESLEPTDVWGNEVAAGSLAVRMNNTTVAPKLEYLAGGSSTVAVAVPFGNDSGFAGGSQPVGDRTIALLIGGAGSFDRWFVSHNGFFLSSTSTGWIAASRGAGQAPVTRATLTGAVSAPNTRYVVLLSSTATGNIRLRVKKANEATVTATAASQPRGSDMEFKLGAVVYNGTALGSHQIAHVVTWDRVLTQAEEDSVIAAMTGL